MSNKKCDCSVEKCDIFDFMALHVGLTVIHPGGLKATAALAEGLKIGPDSRVIDIGCGKGTGAVHLARTIGCHVTGVDLSPELIEQAESLAGRKGLEDRVRFRVGNALKLPYADGAFDAAFSQAVLVLLTDQERAVREALRVIRPGGAAGWLELSWKKPMTPEFMDGVSNVLCAYCMRNVRTFDGWKTMFAKAGLKRLQAQAFPLGGMAMSSMRRDEGIAGSIQILFKTVTDGAVRRRMKTMRKFFQDHEDFFGYGIYTGHK
jgi:ubiquinone/menaquinone biosynthesis C-methylase UbiE